MLATESDLTECTRCAEGCGVACSPAAREGEPAGQRGDDLSRAEHAALRIDQGKRIAILITLTALVWVVFGPTVTHQFVNYDDQNYVYQNPRIISGITINGIGAAFTQFHAQNWHPLTTLSHMLDCQLFGLDAAGHHLVNVLLHTVATLLLFSILNRMTGAVWRSAFVAAVFAIHPLRAESVAWISERKDVLSGVFFMLTLHAYTSYVKRPGLRTYALTVVVFALGLMSKATLVTAPVLLLLLDYWPLKRLRFAPTRGSGPVRVFTDKTVIFSLIEKLPFLLMSLFCSIITLTAQKGTVGYGRKIPIAGRLANAVVSYVAYIGQTFWPMKLTVFYTEAWDRLRPGTIVVCAVILTGITVAAWCLRTKWPYLLIGWCWYLVSLIPVIGIVQVGLQGRADRYTYLSQLGLTMAFGWGMFDLLATRSRTARRLMAGAAAGIVVSLASLAAIQSSYWKTTESLWMHAVSVDPDNDIANNNVAALLMGKGRVDQAIAYYQAALRQSQRGETHYHLSPAIVYNNLGNAYAQKGQVDAAVDSYRNAVRIRADYSDARVNLATMLMRKGELNKAISEYQKVVVTPPEDGIAHQRLAEMLLKANRVREAVAEYRRAVAIMPGSVVGLNALAWVLLTAPDPALRDGAEAFRLAERADRLTDDKDPVVLRVLAASHASCGRFAEAEATAERARLLANDNPTFTSALEPELRSYRSLAIGQVARAGLK